MSSHVHVIVIWARRRNGIFVLLASPCAGLPSLRLSSTESLRRMMVGRQCVFEYTQPDGPRILLVGVVGPLAACGDAGRGLESAWLVRLRLHKCQGCKSSHQTCQSSSFSRPSVLREVSVTLPGLKDFETKTDLASRGREGFVVMSSTIE